MVKYIFITFLAFFIIFNLSAQKIKLDLDKADNLSYRPLKIKLTNQKPLYINKLPKKLSENVLYGEILITENDNQKKIAVILDNNPERGQVIWVDGNGNGDLTDDNYIKWLNYETKKDGKTFYANFSGNTTISVKYGTEIQDYSLNLFRLEPASLNSSEEALFYYRNWCHKGFVQINDKSYAAVLDDEFSSCDFRGNPNRTNGSGVTLGIDFDNDGKFDKNNEKIDVLQPFKFYNDVFEILVSNANGKGLKIVKSTKTDAQSIKIINTNFKRLEVGGIPYSFEAETIDGKKINFPDDFKDKIVMLDFWATWCGPCIAEMAFVKQAYQKYKDKNFEIIGVSFDRAEMVSNLPSYIVENNMPWIHIAEGKSWASSIGAQYSIKAIPFALIYNSFSGEITGLGHEIRGNNLFRAIEETILLKKELKKR